MEIHMKGLPASLKLVQFIPDQASEKVWDTYCALSEMIFRESNPRGRLQDRAAARRHLSTENPLYTVQRWLLLDESHSAAASAWLGYDTALSPDYKGGMHMCQAHISVAPAYRRKKIASRLLKHLLGAALLEGKQKVRAEVDNPYGLDFCRHLHGKKVHQEQQHRLYVEDVDWQSVNAWIEKAKAKSPGTTVEFFKECPEIDIEEFCRMYTEIINQRPIGDMQQELITTPQSRRIEEHNLSARGIDWHTMVSREADGSLSGLTDIMYNPEEPYKIMQYFTGILSKHRRKGLAKRLKAEMLTCIAKHFPDVEYITTSMAHTNAPMRAINRELGFLPQKNVSVFRWELPELEHRINALLAKPTLISS
jgi:GNAT superfamily N-acetyltransferase/RimJ/RimL family protein N-acetyltransferase